MRVCERAWVCSPVSARKCHVALHEVHISTAMSTWHTLKRSPNAHAMFNAQLLFSGENAHSRRRYEAHSVLENPWSMGGTGKAEWKAPQANENAYESWEMRHPGKNDGLLVGLLQYALTPRESHRSLVHYGLSPGVLLVSLEAEFLSVLLWCRHEVCGSARLSLCKSCTAPFDSFTMDDRWTLAR